MIFPLIKKKSILNFVDNKVFLEVFCFLIMLFTVIFWLTNFVVGAIFFVTLSIIILLLFWDLKLVIPIILNCIFIVSPNFVFDGSFDANYLLLFIAVLVFVPLLVIYFIFRGINLKRGSSKSGFLLFSIFSLLPIFWHIKLEANQQFMIFLYFVWIVYFALYLLVLNGSDKDLLDVVVKTFTYMPILFMIEVIVATHNEYQNYLSYMEYLSKTQEVNILSILQFEHGANMGWGIGNEACIMLLFTLPFAFYRLIKLPLKLKFIPAISIIAGIVATIFTCSRGGYLAIPASFAGAVLIYAIYLFKGGKKKSAIAIISTCFIIFVCSLILFFTTGLVDTVFKDKNNPLQSSGRFTRLYPEAWYLFTKNPRNFIFGHGMITYFDTQNRVVVFHSTFFETIAAMGIIGFFILCLHFFQKYRTTFKKFDLLAAFILLSYITTDIYGMLDNSYHMYYYMIPLCIFMAVYERHFELENNKIETIC